MDGTTLPDIFNMLDVLSHSNEHVRCQLVVLKTLNLLIMASKVFPLIKIYTQKQIKSSTFGPKKRVT